MNTNAQNSAPQADSSPSLGSVICDLKYIIGAGGHEYSGSKADTLAAMKAAVRELRRLQMAVRWALGEVGDFPMRQEGQGAYWWRTELRKRAGLSPNE